MALFQVDNKDGISCFSEKTFIWVDINIDVDSNIFLTLSNVEVNFNDCELR